MILPKKYFKPVFTAFFLIVVACTIVACVENYKDNKETTVLPDKTKKKNTSPTSKAARLSKEFKDYWHAGKAEITSYKLQQARYGEIREGTAVLIFVTEPFLPEKQVKADHFNNSNISVLKLNSTKNFLTGIYPYSIMSSTFYPTTNNQHAIKVTSSIQEWCGQVFAQLNNRNNFEIKQHSYFESEGDQEFSIKKTHLENEIWTKIRMNPKKLPLGSIEIVPSLEFTRLNHTPIKAYKATTSLETGENLSTYTIHYPTLERTLKITFNTQFPHEIESWTDTYKSGFGPNAKTLTSSATKINSIKSAYWQKNANTDVSLRDTLGI
jgi:hypothetical protein